MPRQLIDVQAVCVEFQENKFNFILHIKMRATRIEGIKCSPRTRNLVTCQISTCQFTIRATHNYLLQDFCCLFVPIWWRFCFLQNLNWTFVFVWELNNVKEFFFSVFRLIILNHQCYDFVKIICVMNNKIHYQIVHWKFQLT